MTRQTPKDEQGAAPTTPCSGAYLEGKPGFDTTPDAANQPEKPEPAERKALTPMKAIRAKCLDCCCGQPGEVRACQLTHCALHPYRMGKRPQKSRRVLSETEKAERLARLGNARANPPEKLEAIRGHGVTQPPEQHKDRLEAPDGLIGARSPAAAGSTL